MIQSSSETATSPTPISPFSSYSVRSEPTSDGQSSRVRLSHANRYPELPDLGAFLTVFRALNHIQTPRAFGIPVSQNDVSDTSEFNSQVPSPVPEDTVWTHRPIQSYLAHGDETDLHLVHSDPRSGSDTEGEVEMMDGQTVEIEDLSDLDEQNQPSLGYLDEALSFIAAERERFHLQREAGTITTSAMTATHHKGAKVNGSGGDNSAWRHVVEPRRKRRRRRKGLPISNSKDVSASTTMGEDGGSVVRDTTAVDHDVSADDSSSSFDDSFPHYFKSTPATPPRTKNENEKRLSSLSASGPHPKLSHSRSTPSFRLSLTMPLDPRILQLRSLAHKLRLLFPEDAPQLTAILSNNDLAESASSLVDPRGPTPQSQDTLIHIFIDQSVKFPTLRL